MPWKYLFTAAQTELGKSEEWFWDVTPRVLVTMLDEKKRIDIANWKIQGCLNQGGEIEFDGIDEDVLPGIDCPANVNDMAFMV